MSREAPQISRLANLLAGLPGLGPRSARRLLFHLVCNRSNAMLPLAAALEQVAAEVSHCGLCRNLDAVNPCSICADHKRLSRLCVVETVADLWALERYGVHRGQYFVLGGVLSAQKGTNPLDLGLPQLLERTKALQVDEVIVATNPTVEGQTTAWYIAGLLKKTGVKVSMPAHGLPLGAELDYMDEGTLAAAFKQRKTA